MHLKRGSAKWRPFFPGVRGWWGWVVGVGVGVLGVGWVGLVGVNFVRRPAGHFNTDDRSRVLYNHGWLFSALNTEGPLRGRTDQRSVLVLVVLPLQISRDYVGANPVTSDTRRSCPRPFPEVRLTLRHVCLGLVITQVCGLVPNDGPVITNADWFNHRNAQY